MFRVLARLAVRAVAPALCRGYKSLVLFTPVSRFCLAMVRNLGKRPDDTTLLIMSFAHSASLTEACRYRSWVCNKTTQHFHASHVREFSSLQEKTAALVVSRCMMIDNLTLSMFSRWKTCRCQQWSHTRTSAVRSSLRVVDAAHLRWTATPLTLGAFLSLSMLERRRPLHFFF